VIGGGDSSSTNHSDSMDHNHLLLRKTLKTARRANKSTFQELPQITIYKLAEPAEGKGANEKGATPKWVVNKRIGNLVCYQSGPKEKTMESNTLDRPAKLSNRKCD